jgi:hypothetical protein
VRMDFKANLGHSSIILRKISTNYYKRHIVVGFCGTPGRSRDTVPCAEGTGVYKVVQGISSLASSSLLDCWTAPCMSGRFYTEPQEQRLFVWKEVTGIRENRANRV